MNDAEQDRPRVCNGKTHLILVCCHATYIGGKPYDETSWVLQPFQQSDQATGKSGEHHTFISHIEAGAALLRHDPDSVLMFSGGKTQDLLRRTEAESYSQVFIKMHMWQRIEDYGSDVDKARMLRTIRERHATDSYQNLLFSIAKFRKLAGQYPKTITVITHAFKERRFLELHAKAIKWPTNRIRVLGINPPFTQSELRETERGEQERGFGAFQQDMFGVRSPLADKRKARNWDPAVLWSVGEGLEDNVKDLLVWDGGKTGHEIFPGKLPWE